jgi:hypothetical protein
MDRVHVLRCAAFAGACAALCGVGCGGSADAPGLDGGGHPGDGAAATAPPDEGGAQEKAEGDAGPDATTGEGGDAGGATAVADAGDARTPAFDAAPFGVDPVPTGKKICEVDWPQAGGETFLFNSADVVVDAAGDALVAFKYNEAKGDGFNGGTDIDLGLASPGYALGIAIAKIDSACNVEWVRELGTSAAGANTADIELAGMAVDSALDVTLAGSVIGPMTLGNVVLDAGTVNVAEGDASSEEANLQGYLVRFDTYGNLVFSRVFSSTSHLLGVNSLAVDAAGKTTVLAFADPDADFGAGPAPGDDAGHAASGSVAAENAYLVQFDGTGDVVAQQVFDDETLASSVPYTDLFSDPGGHIYAHATRETDAGQVLQVARLDADAGILSSFDSPQGAVQLAPNAAGQFTAYGYAYVSSGGATETIEPPAYDGGFGPPVSTAVGFSFDFERARVALDAQGRAVVGGLFFGTSVRDANGGYGVEGEPKGVGFQAFDANGALTSIGVRTGDAGDTQAFFGMDVDPYGNIAVVGTSAPAGSYYPAYIFFAWMSE